MGDAIRTVDIVEPATIRLISTAHITEPAMAPLADDATELDFLAEIESQTSMRQDAEMPLPTGVRRSELLTEAHGYGWSYVNAAFCYTRAEGSRFNGPERGAWYAALGEDAVRTAQAEVAYHLTRELENVGVFDNITDYRELLAGFLGVFADLRGAPDAPHLDPDTEVGHPAGQRLARRLREEGLPGAIYPSVRRPGGQCLAAFRPNLVQNIRQGATWRFTWSGSPTPGIDMVT